MTVLKWHGNAHSKHGAIARTTSNRAYQIQPLIGSQHFATCIYKHGFKEHIGVEKNPERLLKRCETHHADTSAIEARYV
ncbi:hypothetical protein [Flexibacterium corallicola]|uniref:hypothetical protein n=1 Tax=Flexibacterium corallicola TaxID=3037259 RepID=UPI00286F1C8A|nr:hypothetical protein [Pseudovibrio sp. M1P-2-3]